MTGLEGTPPGEIAPPPVTVIVPTYRRPDALDRLLAAVLPQIRARAHRAIVVVNDGSHDARYAALIARHAGALRYLALPDNRGPGGARNAAAVSVTTGYLLFADDDCLPPPLWLDWLDAIVAEHPHLGVVAGMARPLAKARAGWIERFRIAKLRYPRPIADGARLLSLPALNLAVRRDWFARVGGFRAEMRAGGEDLNLTYRLIRAGAPVRVDPHWHSFHDLDDTPLGLLRRYRRYGHGAAHHARLEADDTPYGLAARETRLSALKRAARDVVAALRGRAATAAEESNVMPSRWFDAFDAVVGCAYRLGGIAGRKGAPAPRAASAPPAAPAPPAAAATARLVDAAGAPRVTIVVTQRERFSYTQASLESLYAATPGPFRLVVVDGGAPPAVARYLAAESARRGFRLLRHERLLPPQIARKFGAAEAASEFVVFAENDILFRPGWLEALVRCADETGAGAVGPLYLIDHRVGRHVAGRPDLAQDNAGQDIVHMAGGEARFAVEGGKRLFCERHYFCEEPLAAVRGLLKRERTDMVEFHCLLARYSLLADGALLDEAIPNGAAHIDFCLAAAARAAAVYLEPDAVVVNVPAWRLRRMDWPLYYAQWNDRLNRACLARFAAKWKLATDDPWPAHHYAFLTDHRRLMLMPATRRLSRLVGRRLALKAEDALDAVLERVLVPRDQASSARQASST